MTIEEAEEYFRTNRYPLTVGRHDDGTEYHRDQWEYGGIEVRCSKKGWKLNVYCGGLYATGTGDTWSQALQNAIETAGRQFEHVNDHAENP